MRHIIYHIDALHAHFIIFPNSLCAQSVCLTIVPVACCLRQICINILWEIRPHHPKPDTQNGTSSYLHLIDNLTGVDVDCLENEEYVFAADPSDYDSRFKLVFAYTGVEENEIELPDNFAFFNGNDLIVNGEGRLECIDLQGRVLFVTDLYGTQNHVALPDFSSGMYLLSLRNGKQCMVQKIIIK